MLIITPIQGGERFYRAVCAHATHEVLFIPGPRGLTPSEIAWEVVRQHIDIHACPCCAHVVPEHKQMFTGRAPVTLNLN